MNNEHYHYVSEAAIKLAESLPQTLMFVLAKALTQHLGIEKPEIRQAIIQSLPNPDFRGIAAEFLNDWQTNAASVGAEAVAVALVTAAKSEHDHQHDETTEIVWTGPESVETRFRKTEQAILEVVNMSTKRLTVVSYAVYKIPRICEALIAAANRGVSINIIVETPNRIDGQGEYDCLLALGNNVASASSVYYWPQEKRGKDDNGKIGILHVKCAVADGHRMFLSSANFTEYAFNINMELGILVTGGMLPGQVERHFERLIEVGHLAEV